MLKFSRVATALVACAIILPVTGCATNRAKSDVNYVASDVNTLYGVAKERLDRGEYEDAAKLFDEVERQHPYSVWARRAQLMSAFSYYLARKYPEAVSSARRFLTIHPGNKEAPYAHYLVAMSHYQQMEDVTRDQRITQQAADAFGDLRRRDVDEDGRDHLDGDERPVLREAHARDVRHVEDDEDVGHPLARPDDDVGDEQALERAVERAPHAPDVRGRADRHRQHEDRPVRLRDQPPPPAHPGG